MPQLNINVTPAFDRALRRFMRLRGLANKSDAVRVAVEEAAERASASTSVASFAKLKGAGVRAPQNPNPRFRTDDDLWR